MTNETPLNEFFRCHYCGCSTNARVRACCELGELTDLKRLDKETVEKWKVEAENVLEPTADDPHDYDRAHALLAGRLLVTADEVERLRECRDGMGRLSQQLARSERALARADRDEHAASERGNRLSKTLSDVCVIIGNQELSAEVVRRQLFALLTGEKDGREEMPKVGIEGLRVWKVEAQQLGRHGDGMLAQQCKRVVALVEGFELLQSQIATDGKP